VHYPPIHSKYSILSFKNSFFFPLFSTSVLFFPHFVKLFTHSLFLHSFFVYFFLFSFFPFFGFLQIFQHTQLTYIHTIYNYIRSWDLSYSNGRCSWSKNYFISSSLPINLRCMVFTGVLNFNCTMRKHSHHNNIGPSRPKFSRE